MNIPLVEFISLRQCEDPFVMHGHRFRFVNVRRPDGHLDIGVYHYETDLCYDYLAWREAYNLP